MEFLRPVISSSACRSLLLRSLLLLLAWPVFVSAETSEYDLKAAFIYNFTQFVSWPDAAFRSPNAPFDICIFGTNPFGTALQDVVENESVKDHPLRVVPVADVQQMGGCQIVFFAKEKSAVANEAASLLASSPVLTIGDFRDFADKGGIIAFDVTERKVKLKINLAAAKSSRLVISSKLLRFSEIVKGR